MTSQIMMKKKSQLTTQEMTTQQVTTISLRKKNWTQMTKMMTHLRSCQSMRSSTQRTISQLTGKSRSTKTGRVRLMKAMQISRRLTKMKNRLRTKNLMTLILQLLKIQRSQTKIIKLIHQISKSKMIKKVQRKTIQKTRRTLTREMIRVRSMMKIQKLKRKMILRQVRLKRQMNQ